VLPATAMAQPYIYPDKGQTFQQQESDKGQCYGWAVQQTGFDPANPQVAQPTGRSGTSCSATAAP